AIDQLNHLNDIEDTPEQSRRTALHLDHDTKGLRGSPEIAHEIFSKILHSTVVVADVTPIGKTPTTDATKPQPMTNPNAVVELGYAFGKVGTDCFLPVLNEAFGDITSLTFDIIHRRRPVVFNLSERATRAELEREKKKLIEQFVTALKPYLAEPTVQAAPSLSEVQPKIGKAFYFADGEVLHRNDHLNASFVMPFRTVFYMRVIPRTPLDGHLDLHKVRQGVGKYGSFGLPAGCFVVENKHGVMVASPAGNTSNLDDVLQYFRTGEIWAINAGILREGERGRTQYVFTAPIENTFIAG